MRAAVIDLQESRIRGLANAGIGCSDRLALWFGQRDALHVAKRLLAEAGPGTAVGIGDAELQGCGLRWCFVSGNPQRRVAGVERLGGCSSGAGSCP